MSGCGSAVLAAGFPALGIGFLGVSLAFGLTVLTMAYAVGHISGGHFNCAVTIGLWAGGPFKASDVIPYIIAQVAGAIVAAAVLYAIASGKPDWVADGIPIGLCLTLIHLFLIPVTNASVNPARSTGPALFAGGAYISQLWLFWLARRASARLLQASSAGGSTVWLTPHRRDASRTALTTFPVAVELTTGHPLLQND